MNKDHWRLIWLAAFVFGMFIGGNITHYRFGKRLDALEARPAWCEDLSPPVFPPEESK